MISPPAKKRWFFPAQRRMEAAAGVEPMPPIEGITATFVRITNAPPPPVHRGHFRHTGWLASCGVVAIAAFLLLARREAPALPLSAVSAEAAPPAPETAVVEPTPAPVSAVTPPAPEASSKIIVDRLAIKGLIGGPRPRAIVNGELKAPGEMIDRASGLLIYAIEVEKRTVTFADSSGQIYRRMLD